VETKSQSITSLLAAVDTARKTPGVNVVSMSWGYPEVRTDASYNSHFQTPAGHVGITFVASSGDSGAKADNGRGTAHPHGEFQLESGWLEKRPPQAEGVH